MLATESSLSMRHRVTLPILLSMIFVDSLGYGLILPLLPTLVQTGALRGFAVGGVASVYAGMQLLGMPLLGRISDRLGRRPVLLVSILGTAVAYFIIAFTRSVWVIYIAVALDGLTAGSLTAAQSAIADRWTGHRRARYLGWLSAAFAAGIVGGPLFGGLLGTADARLAPLIAGYLATANLLWGLFMLQETRAVTSRGQETVREPDSRQGRDRRVLRFAVVAFSINFAFMMLPANLPVFATDQLGWDSRGIGGLLATGAAVAGLTQVIVVGKLTRRLSTIRALALALSIMSVALAIVPLVPRTPVASPALLLYPVIALFSFGTSLAIPLVGNAVAERAGRARTGAAIGTMNSAIGASMFASPLIAGAAYDAIGSWAPYALGAAVAAAAAAVVLTALPGRPAPPDLTT